MDNDESNKFQGVRIGDNDKYHITITIIIMKKNKHFDCDVDDDELKKFLGVRIAQAGGCHFPSFANQRPRASSIPVVIIIGIIFITIVIIAIIIFIIIAIIIVVTIIFTVVQIGVDEDD